MALAVGLVVAACGSSDDDDAGGVQSTTTGAPPSTEAPTPTATTTTTTQPDELPAAADGTDLTACRDGNCEVLVETFPVEVALDGAAGMPSITLVSAGHDGLTSGDTSATGMVSRLTAAVGQTSTYNTGTASLVVEPIAIVGGAAVVRLTSR